MMCHHARALEGCTSGGQSVQVYVNSLSGPFWLVVCGALPCDHMEHLGVRHAGSGRTPSVPDPQAFLGNTLAMQGSAARRVA